MARHYPLEKEHNVIKFRNWTIVAANAADQPNYKIYYRDDEWNTAASSGSNASAAFTKLQTIFDDGVNFFITGKDGNSTGTFTCIVVRLSDRKAVKCQGVVSGAELCDNAKWTCTDVSDSVFYDELRKLLHLGYI